MLSASNLSVKKGSKTILESLNLEFKKGCVTAICGANGAGKSSLLDALFMLEDHQDVRINGELFEPNLHQSKIGYMLQNFHTHANLSALEVVLLGAYEQLNLRIDDAVLERALALLERFDLLHLANESIHTLSGGQKQMISFAQVLLKRPQVLLLDEPVSALDLRYSCILLSQLRQICAEDGLCALVVLHDLNLASLYCDEVLMLKDTKVRAFGDANEVFSKELISEIYGVNVRLIDGGERNIIDVLGSS